MKGESHGMLRVKKYKNITFLLFLTWFNWRLSATDIKCQAPSHLLHLEGTKFLALELGPAHLICKVGGVEDGCFSNSWRLAEDSE